MGVLDFWGTIPRLVPQFVRRQGQPLHFVAVHFRPSQRAGLGPYDGIGPGNKPRTELEAELDHVQACLVADLECIVKALGAVEARRQTNQRRKSRPKTLDDALKSAPPGPSSIETLLRNGRRYIQERETRCEPAYRGYLTPAKVARLAAIGDAETLNGLIDAHVKAFTLVARARLAAQTTAKGFRATLIEVFKGKRRNDDTISRDMLDGLSELSIMEMTCLSLVSGVNASRIWQCYHGAPYTIDYYRLFELAVFAGRLSRGEPAPITWDLARYFQLHLENPNINRSWRVLLYPNTVQVHYALEWIRGRIEDICGIDELNSMLERCSMLKQNTTLRLNPLTV